MVARVRRLLVDSAIAYRDHGRLPQSADHAEIYGGARGGQFVAAPDADWVEAYRAQLERAPWQQVGKTATLA
jgi:hypothetical protein